MHPPEGPRRVVLPTDYPSADGRAALVILQDNQGDFHITLQTVGEDAAGQTVRIAASGGHYSFKVRKALAALMNIVTEDISTRHDRILIETNSEE